MARTIALDRRSQQLLIASHEAEQCHGARQEIAHWERALADARRQLALVRAGAGEPGQTEARTRESVRLFEQRVASATDRAQEAEAKLQVVVEDVCERCGLQREDAKAASIVKDADGLAIEVVVP